MLPLQPDKITTVAEHDFRFERQLPEQCSTEPCSRSRFANDERACRTHIHDIVVAQFSSEDAGAKRPVPANIDTPEENNESHSGGRCYPFLPSRSNRYASSGPSSPSYASCAMSSVNGSVYRAIRKGPASTGSNPTSRMSRAATFLLRASSPQYTRLGRLTLRRASKTPNNTSLGTVPNAETTRALGTFLASSSAPEEVWAITSPVSSVFIGSEQVTITLPDTSPACWNTSSTRDQCTAKRSASAPSAASRGVPARAFPFASRASFSSFCSRRA